MNPPIITKDYASAPLFSARDLLNQFQSKAEAENMLIPERVLLCYQGSLLAYTKSKYKMLKSALFPGQLNLPECFGGKLGIFQIPGCGAPVSALFLEQLIACGVKKFISFGTAGALQPDLKLGDMILCDKALRDEGTSYHYLPPARYSYAGTATTAKIEKELAACSLAYTKGAAWTTDAIFRETQAAIEEYQKEGVLAVDMEAAALFAVAECRNAELGIIFIISDILANSHWEPGFFNKKVIYSLHTTLEKVFSILLNL